MDEHKAASPEQLEPEDVDKYLTRYFGIPPQTFVDGVYNMVCQYESDAVDTLKTYLLKEFSSSGITPEALDAACKGFLDDVAKVMDKAFDKLEVFLMGNVFHIPHDLLLKELNSKTNMQNIPSQEEDEKKLDAEIQDLHRRIKSAKYAIACLQMQALQQDAFKQRMETTLMHLNEMNNISTVHQEMNQLIDEFASAHNQKSG